MTDGAMNMMVQRAELDRLMAGWQCPECWGSRVDRFESRFGGPSEDRFECRECGTTWHRAVTPASFWSYRASEPTPSYAEAVEAGAVADGDPNVWEQLSPGMRREIMRSAKR